jgi:uncharacterized protein YeeX (DUF496 family)
MGGDYMINGDMLTIFKKELPEKVIDIGEALELLLDTLSMTRIDIGIRMQKANYCKDFDLLEQLTAMSMEIAVIEANIQDFYSLLEIDSKQKNLKNEIYKKIEREKPLPDYEKCRVDTNVEYSLYEDFTHKRPCAFSMEGQKIMVDTWQEMLIKTVEILYRKDQEKMESFTDDEKMNGRKVRYFSLSNKSNMNKPVGISGSKLFIETNLSANSIRNLLVKMLQRYEIRINDFIVYLRADYSNLHSE